MNRMLVIALLVVNLIVLGMAVRVVGAYRSVAPYQTAPLTVTASAFTYQGRLQHNGQLVTGPCDFSFDLFDASNAGNMIAGQDLKAMPVTAGLFTVLLDFGADAFNSGPRWLETTVQCDEAEGTWTLAPRQPITVAPIALSARTATSDASPQLEGTPSEPLGAMLSAINDGDGPGLRGQATTGAGVLGLSTSGAGVYGISNTGPGLAGSSNHGSAVYGYGYYSDAVGVTGEGNNGAPAMKAKGNAIQTADSFGLVKALLNVTSFGDVSQCYNGVTGQQTGTGDCGFTVNHVYTGVYIINFGFKVSDRFIVVTPRNGGYPSNFAQTGYDSTQETQITVFTDTPAAIDPELDTYFSIAVF